ncbi:MAG: metallophosphoesterase [Bacteroidales bacterium]|nr:metallophosphoesterase [Bacteroidales bacterium]
MKNSRIIASLLILTAIVIGLFQQSCKKKETIDEPVYLTVSLPKLTLQNELYYSLRTNERAIELEFNQPIDSSTIRGNFSFSDKSGNLDTTYTLITIDRKIVLMFQPGFTLKEGWRYLINIGTGLRSTSGTSFPSACTLEFRSSTLTLTLGASSSTTRNAILCISDIHLGEYRAVTENYCWFSKNQAALIDLLDYVITGQQVRQLVILGDLFDGWVIPYRSSPFDSAAGVYSPREYFLSVANSPVNIPVINKLKEIASNSDIQLIYVPGNHDMLLTKSILEEIIPGVVWQGNVPGLGNYSPVEEMIMEHGHRYDLFNCPQPLVNVGHILPPGFFISRLQAAGLKEHHTNLLKEGFATKGSVEFKLAWTLAFEYVRAQFAMTVHPDSVNILMNGIDGYTNRFSFNGIRDMYAASIEDKWPATQTQNAVPVQMPVVMAILDGNMDMFFAASYEYMSSVAPKKYKIVAFGHTHNPEIKVYPSGKNYQGIYANSGSWVNGELSSKAVRTYLMIWPGKWTGSDLDVVSLYQYNLNSGNGNPNPDYTHTLLAEESINIGN